MTKESEIELAKRAKTGDQRAITELYNQYLPMMRHYCRKYKALDNLTQEDLVQYCAIYFMKTIDKFDPSKNNKFGTMLYTQLQQIHRDVLYQDMTVRRPAERAGVKTEFRCISVDTKLDDSENTFADMHEDESARFWVALEESETNSAINLAFKNELDTYNALDRTIIELLIYANYGNKRVREDLDLKAGKVEHLIKKFRVVMRDKLAKV